MRNYAVRNIKIQTIPSDKILHRFPQTLHVLIVFRSKHVASEGNDKSVVFDGIVCMYVIKLYTFFCGVAHEYVVGPSCDGHVARSSSNNNNNNNNCVTYVLGEKNKKTCFVSCAWVKSQ